ncbi:PKD domain-containing protein [Apibacter muscae]|uniref:PKD domain-containing protein n=1 Tax=Apibacter muscae TaxID=2509004 RepID=UPI0011ACE9C5|nr:PKD domain-containing protein [Apibacter muscae]TWP29240.1 PKD domain-containing protein [Apibacter muscae]
MKLKKYLFCLLGIMITLQSCYKDSIIEAKAAFELEYVQENYSIPVQIHLLDKSEGAENWEWSFEGAIPSSSHKKNPGTITYETPGEYTISLTVTNKDGGKDTYTETIRIYDAIKIDFSAQIINNQANYPPVQVELQNNTEGIGFTYLWEFEGGMPSISTEKIPPVVIFSTPGEHKITLTVDNGNKKERSSKIITVADNISSLFHWEVSLFDNDYQAPVRLQLKNQSKNATAYLWTFEGATPSVSTEKEPAVVYQNPGTYTIKLETDNGSSQSVSEQTITIYKDTNLRLFKNIKLGTHSAHTQNTQGAFFSTVMQRSYTAQEVNETNSNQIDLVFFGLSPAFTYNKFVSPNKVSSEGFPTLPNAQPTIFVNSQELCNCGTLLSPEQFEGMSDDHLLQSLTPQENPAGLQRFGNTTPRVILFQTQDGRKGAIKINQMVNQGEESFIICDIKVQKTAK